MRPEKFFAIERRRPLRWDATDCCHTADRWCRQASGRSFIAAYGRDYDTAKGAARLIEERPLPIHIARAMRKAGFRMTRDPMPGDIGVVALGQMVVCAVRGDRMWFFRGSSGISAVHIDVRLLGAWSIV